MITFAANNGSTNIAPLLISALAIGVLFFVMIVRPQKKNTQRHAALINAMSVGDEIITSGGIYGALKSIDDETVELEIAKGTVITVSKRAIAMKKVTTTEEVVAVIQNDDTESTGK